MSTVDRHDADLPVPSDSQELGEDWDGGRIGAMANVDSGAAGAQRPAAILQALNHLEHIVAIHTEWLKNWHLEVMSGIATDHPAAITPPRLELPQWVDHPVLRQHPQHQHITDLLTMLQRQAEGIADVVRQTGAIPTADYGTFMNTVLAFASSVRQLQSDTWNQLANVDPLTSLGNRRAMWRKLRIECERQARNRHPCCLAMLDLDLFKEINDTLGHGAGDAVLRAVAATLTDSIRPYDAVFRFGGDEFLLCLPSADLRAAWAIIERLRLKIGNLLIPVKQGDEVSTTISVGIAPMDAETGVEASLERADAALYSAKRHGRNRVCVWNERLR